MAVDNDLASRNAVNVRFYRPGDEEGILRVLQAAFPRWPNVEISVSPIEHLRWKLAGAVPPERNHIIAEVEGQIVGVRLAITQYYSLRGDNVLARTDMDVAVAPEYRGRGVYSLMSRFGITDALDAQIAINSTDRASLVDMGREGGHRPLKNRMVSMVCALPFAQPTDTAAERITVREAAAFDDRTGSFWQEAIRPFQFAASPTVEWLNWRYCDARGGVGTLLLAENGPELLGFAALRCSRGHGHIAYMLALPDRLDVVRVLANRSVSYFHAASIPDIDCGLPRRHPYRTVLVEQGFSQKGRSIPLSCRANPDGARDVTYLEEPRLAVHLMLGDTDLV